MERKNRRAKGTSPENLFGRKPGRLPASSRTRRRAPVVNGIFYPENPETLRDGLASWGLKEGARATGGQAILAPHGAWELTGSIAASAFKAVQKKGEKTGRQIRTVVLLGKYHQSTAEEGIYLSESDTFETPLGELLVNRKLNLELASCSTLIRVNDIPHLSEHSLEVLLPMVKYCFPEAGIVPILMSGGRRRLISGLAKALRIVLENYMEESLIIISSTVSQNADSGLALSMADEFRTLFERMDTRAFLDCLSSGRISACGGSLACALLESGLLEGKRFSSLTALLHSAEEDGQTVYHGAFASRVG